MAVQEDLALALVLRLLSAEGLEQVAQKVEAIPQRKQKPHIAGFFGAAHALSRHH